FSDFFPTFCELAGAKAPDDRTIDGHSLAPQIRGEKGDPRKWIYVELNGKSYARDARFKLTMSGELFDLSEAPYQEKPVDAASEDAAAKTARAELQKVLDDHPALPPSGKAKAGKKGGRKAGKLGKGGGKKGGKRGKRKNQPQPSESTLLDAAP